VPPNEERRPPADQAGAAAAKRVDKTTASVTRTPCPAVRLDGDPCQAWAATDGWPFCSSHRWTHRHLAADSIRTPGVGSSYGKGVDSTGTPGAVSHEKGLRQIEAPTDAWADVYASATAWINAVAQPRWPEFAVNDAVWAVSIADWATRGRRSAA
jgi:hypothetical protein